MLELKYRIWDKRYKEFADDVIILPNGTLGLDLGWDGLQPVFENRENDFEISKCTGKRDKFGKEIYAGDIVRIFPEKREKFWFEKLWRSKKPSEPVDMVVCWNKDWAEWKLIFSHSGWTSFITIARRIL